MKELPPLLYPHITAFPMIDGAICRVVRAAVAYEKAIYTSNEGGAIKLVVREAMNLKQAFEKLAKHINEEYELEQITGGQESQEDKDSKAQ